MYYGWRVVAGTFISQMFFVGYFSYATSLLTPYLRAEFDVSLEQVMYGMTIATLAGLLFSPVAGALVDRMSVRFLMALGSIIFGVGLLLMARSESIVAYVWLFGLTMALGNVLANTIPAMAVVSRWFRSNRGRALGIAAIGTSVGGALIPALVSAWLEAFGWRMTLDYMAICVLLLMLPATVILIRGRPEDVGLSSESSGDGTEHTADEGVSTRQIVANPDFWSMGISLGLTMAAYSAVLANLAPYAVASGHSAAAGSGLIMAVAIMGLIGKLIFGAGADRFNLKFGLWAAQGLAVTAFALFAALPGYPLMLVAACCMGLAAGGLLPVWGAMLAKIFGLRSYGLAMGLMTPLVTLCVMPSFILVGRLVDASGTFQLPMLLLAGANVLAAACLLPLRLRR